MAQSYETKPPKKRAQNTTHDTLPAFDYDKATVKQLAQRVREMEARLLPPAGGSTGE